MISLACPDWEARIAAGKSLVPAAALSINPAESARVVSIFNKLRLADVSGTPALAEAAGAWFREIVAALLGSIDPATGHRIVRECFALVPKKNSKTSYGAGLMLTALLANKRPRAEFLLVGPTQAVADLAFDQAAGMIENDPEGFLQKRIHVQGHLKAIVDRRTKAVLRIKSFDSSVMTGVKPAGVLLDELHEISRNSRASGVVGQIRGGLLPYPEGFLFIITTQSETPPSGVFKAELQMARAIRDGRAIGNLMPVLYEFPRPIMTDKSHPAAWENPSNWPMVLPNIGRPVTIDRLVEDFATAKQKGDEEIRRWASQHLNVEIGLALGSDRWIGADYWERNADPSLTLDEIKSRSEIVVAGIDGGGLDDLLGLVVLGRDKATRNWLCWCHAWAHRSVLARRKDIAPRLLDFERDGDLTVVEHVGDDVVAVADIVEELESAALLPERIAVGVDQAGISEIVDELAQRGIAPERIGGVPQGWKLTNAIKTAERKLASGALKHGGQPLMTWNVGNARVEPRGNAIMITKQTAGSAKIDTLMALFDAIVAMGQNPDACPSIYEERDMIVL